MIKFIFALSIFLTVFSSTISTVWAELSKHPSLSVSIGVPINQDTRTIDLLTENDHFHVLVSNTSESELKLWRDWNSWGYFNLSFEVTNDKGKKWLMVRKDKVWTKNFPDFITVSPGESQIIPIDFNPLHWDNAALLNSPGSHKLTIRAVYESKETDESKKHGIWTGKLVSPIHQYIINK